MADYTLTLKDTNVRNRPRVQTTEYEGISFTVQVFTETGEDWNMVNELNCFVTPTSGSSGDVVTITPIFENLDGRMYAIFRGAINTSVQGQTLGAFNYSQVDSDYGLEVFNTNGIKIIDPTSSFVRIVANGYIPTVAPYTTYTIPITGMVDDGSWDVIGGWTVNDQPSNDLAFIGCDYEINIQTGYFEIIGNDEGWTSLDLGWWVIRW